MQFGLLYRIDAPTLAIYSPAADHRFPVQIPCGAYVKPVAANVDGDRFVDVEWEGKIVTMFKADVQARGVLVTTES